MSASPHTVRMPRDLRGSARPRGTSPGQTTHSSPSVSTGRVTGAQLYAAHRLSGLTRDPRSTGAHDADHGSQGLTSGGLNDRPTRVGGYSNMSHQDGEALRQQFLSEHDDLSPEEQAHWADQAQQQNSANGYANGDGASSPVSSTGQYDFPVETTPRPVQPLAGSPASVGKAVRTVAQADAANGDLAPGYGSARIIHDAPRPQDTTTTDADGTRHIHRPDGGEVAMPAVQRQDGPNDDPAFAATNGRRTGIYVNGKEQVKRPDGSIVPGQGSSLALNTGAKPSDPFSKAATDDFPVSTTPKPDALTASLMNGGTPLAATAMASTVTPPPEPDTTPVPLSVDDSSSTAGPTVHVNGTSQPKLAAPAADSPAPDNEEEGAEQAFPGTTPRPFKRQRSATTL